jgi:hypothetical protein
MKNAVPIFSWLVVLFLSAGLSQAQQGIFIPKKGKVFFVADTSTMFADVINHGTMGVGRNAVINFKGKKWENDAEAQITDETNSGSGIDGVGGLIRFISEGTPQQLVGGYNAATKSGASFYNLQVLNGNDLHLLKGNTKVRNLLMLSNGRIFLHGNNFTVGHRHIGKIEGFNDQRYFVTENQAGNSALIRENISSSNGIVVFPVGTSKGYTPAAIKSKSNLGDDFYVNVFDSVKSAVFSGRNLSSETVNKTWQIGKLHRPGVDEVEVYLQHLNVDEGQVFKANKSKSYVSQYVNGSWDLGTPQSFSEAGFLTSTFTQNNAGVNRRVFMNSVSNSSYFSKFTWHDTAAVKTKLWFSGYRESKELVKLHWRTQPEVNIRYFVVQRQFADENRFTSLDTIWSTAVNGYSAAMLNYFFSDANSYSGVSFYRLRLVDYNNKSSYSNTIAIGPATGMFQVMLWPNPTAGKFFISMNTQVPVKSVIIFNNIGQKLWETNVAGLSVVEIPELNLRPGIYMVSLVGFTNDIIATKKLVIQIP